VGKLAWRFLWIYNSSNKAEKKFSFITRQLNTIKGHNGHKPFSERYEGTPVESHPDVCVCRRLYLADFNMGEIRH